MVTEGASIRDAKLTLAFFNDSKEYNYRVIYLGHGIRDGERKFSRYQKLKIPCLGFCRVGQFHIVLQCVLCEFYAILYLFYLIIR